MGKSRVIWAGALVLAVSAFQPGWAAESGEQAAVWQAKKASFTYQGFTSQYSCDGLSYKIEGILRQLGARKDLKVRESGCPAGSTTPQPLARVSIQMHTLAPSGTAAPGDQATVPAQWKTVELRTGSGGFLDPGDCELIEQAGRELLPLFTTRNVEQHTNCVPHQQAPAGRYLSAEVLNAATPEESRPTTR